MRKQLTIQRTFQHTSILVAMAIALVLIYLAYLTIQLKETSSDERRSSRIVSYVLALQLRTVDLETSERGFILTGSDSFLTPYKKALNSIENIEKELPPLVKNDPEQRKRIGDVFTNIQAYVQEFSDPTISLARYDKRAARSEVASEDGKQRVDNIREQFNKIVDIERNRRDIRAAQSEQLSKRAQLATGSAIFFIMLVLGTFIAYIATVVVRPLRELRDVVGRIADGDLQARPPRVYQGEAEELSSSVSTMASELNLAYSTIEARVHDVENHAKALERSNTDLEQFAYAAAHDLQEPLRMVTSYTLLIERRYKGKLDSEADEFIEHTVDGTRRMQQLINDLLTYSRVTSKSGDLASEVNLNEAIEDAVANLKARIKERDAQLIIEVDPEARLLGYQGQIVMLFQNVIGNALRFASPNNPTVKVKVFVNDNKLIGYVDDNGSGVDPKDRERVFGIFQRLGPKEQHAGTGIGLALCKRIIERHNGTIRIDESPMGGARLVFEFTISSYTELANDLA